MTPTPQEDAEYLNEVAEILSLQGAKLTAERIREIAHRLGSPHN